MGDGFETGTRPSPTGWAPTKSDQWQDFEGVSNAIADSVTSFDIGSRLSLMPTTRHVNPDTLRFSFALAPR